jgi:hypothetical protein
MPLDLDLETVEEVLPGVFRALVDHSVHFEDLHVKKAEKRLAV